MDTTMVREMLERGIYSFEDAVLDSEELGISEITAVDSFEAAGVLTNNEGLVLRVKDAEGVPHEFQITIVKSR